MRVVTSPDPDVWSRYVSEHPHGNIFQTPEMNLVYNSTENYQPLVLALVDENSEILSLLQAVVIRQVRYLGRFASRLVIQGGPLVSKNKKAYKTIEILLKNLDNAICKKVIYSEIRNMWDTRDIHQTLCEAGYKYTPHINFLIDLRKSPEEIFLKFKRDKKRAVRKAKNSGIKIKIANKLEEIEEFYRIISETYKRAGIPKPHRSLFFSVFKILSRRNLAKFFLADLDGEIIAGRLVLCYKDTIFDWYAGSKKDFMRYYPNELLVWYILKWGSENNYSVFDFGGAGDPRVEYGVRDFKKRFGGKKVEFGRYKKVYSPIILKMVETGLKVLKGW